MKETIRGIINSVLKKHPCEIDIRYDEPMSSHTTFKVGGPADCWLRPSGGGFPAFAAALVNALKTGVLEYGGKEGEIPLFILGGGANIVVSDKGIRGIVLDTSGYKGCASYAAEKGLTFRGGTTLDEAAEAAAEHGFTGLEFFAGMPGTIGGAVYMNARCYGSEVSDFLKTTDYINGEGERTINLSTVEFGYKKSPFQREKCVILEASFALEKGDPVEIRRRMEENRQDRKKKGHYLYPCAGSAFKNNREFGKPTGQIIDELGLKGFFIGGAQVAPFHGNIVINAGNATAADIRALMNEVAAKVKAAAGFALEPEILFVGDWQDE